MLLSDMYLGGFHPPHPTQAPKPSRTLPQAPFSPTSPTTTSTTTPSTRSHGRPHYAAPIGHMKRSSDPFLPDPNSQENHDELNVQPQRGDQWHVARAEKEQAFLSGGGGGGGGNKHPTSPGRRVSMTFAPTKQTTTF